MLHFFFSYGRTDMLHFFTSYGRMDIITQVEVESTPESRSNFQKQVPTIVKLGNGGQPFRTRLTNTIMMVKETQVMPADLRETGIFWDTLYN